MTTSQKLSTSAPHPSSGSRTTSTRHVTTQTMCVQTLDPPPAWPPPPPPWPPVLRNTPSPGVRVIFRSRVTNAHTEARCTDEDFITEIIKVHNTLSPPRGAAANTSPRLSTSALPHPLSVSGSHTPSTRPVTTLTMSV